MYSILKFIAALFMLAAVLNLKVDAQVSGGTDTLVHQTDIPRIITYQGQLTTTSGTAMNGTHKITATLYSDHLGNNPIWQGSYYAEITNSLFSVELGSGSQKLP